MNTASALVKTLALMQQIAAGDAEAPHVLLKAGEDVPLESWNAPLMLSVEIGPELAATIGWGLETLIDKAAILSLEIGLEGGFNWLGLSLENGFEGIYGGQTAIRIERDQIRFVSTGSKRSEFGWSTQECLIDTLFAGTTASGVRAGDKARRYLEEDGYTMDEIIEIATQAQHAG